MLENYDLDFRREWLSIDDYELKILMLVSVLAENDLAFRGSLPSICAWLNIQNQTKNRQKILDAITSLEDKGYLFHIQDGSTHTLTISNKALKDKRIIKMRKRWVETIKSYKELKDQMPEAITMVDWVKLLKTFVLLKDTSGQISTAEKRAEETGMSKESFKRCLRILPYLDLEDYGCRLYYFIKPIKKHKKEDNQEWWETIGSQIDVMMHFGKEDDEGEESEYTPRIWWPDPCEYEYDEEHGVLY